MWLAPVPKTRLSPCCKKHRLSELTGGIFIILCFLPAAQSAVGQIVRMLVFIHFSIHGGEEFVRRHVGDVKTAVAHGKGEIERLQIGFIPLVHIPLHPAHQCRDRRRLDGPQKQNELIAVKTVLESQIEQNQQLLQLENDYCSKMQKTNEELLKKAEDLRANAKPNSMSAKANLVKDFNERNNK